MRWVDLSPFKPASGAGVASVPIDNAFQKIQDALNDAIIAGAPLASAATINITNPVHQITGTTTIQNISDANAPTQGETVSLWVQSGLTIQNNGGGGNIRTKTGNDRVIVPNEVITFMYDGALWREVGPSVGAASTASTIAALGTGFDGAQAKLRLQPTTACTLAVALPAATIQVTDTADFPTAGTLNTPQGVVTYTGKTTNPLTNTNTFTGCTGGAGTLALGATVSLASGVPPTGYEILGLVYDSSVGRWVSQPTFKAAAWTGASGAAGAMLMAAVLDTGVTGNINVAPGSAIFPWRIMDNAGLLPQFRFTGKLYNPTAAGTIIAEIAYRGADKKTAFPTDQTTGKVDVTASQITVVFAAAVAEAAALQVDSGWCQINAGYTVADYLQLALAFQHSVLNDQSIFKGTVQMRWVG